MNLRVRVFLLGNVLNALGFRSRERPRLRARSRDVGLDGGPIGLS